MKNLENNNLKEVLTQRIWEFHTVPSPPVETNLHYGDTVEIILTNDITGDVYINGQKFNLQENSALFIAPFDLHSASYHNGNGYIKVLHIDLNKLRPFIDIENILLAMGYPLNSISHSNHNFDKIYNLATIIANDETSLSDKIFATLKIFNILISTRKNLTIKHKNSNITKLINYAEENYTKKMTVKDVASYFGYNTDYFSRWVHSNLGITFTDFMNSIRISHACSYLIDGHTIEETAELCGYSDPSYFVKVFKQLRATTPKKYVLDQKQRAGY